MPNALAKTKTQARSISRHKLHHQFAQLHSRSAKSLMQWFFTSGRSRLSLISNFRQGHALPLNFVRFFRLANHSPMNQRSPARWTGDGRATSGKTSCEMSRSQPHHFPAIAGQWQMQCRQMSARATRKTTCNMTRNGQATSASQSAQQTTQQPVKHLARWLAEILPSRFQP